MTKRYRITRQISIMGIMGLLLYGCVRTTSASTPPYTPSPEQMDMSTFTGTPCAAPCWQGLEVGKSTEKDVFEVVPILSFINQESVRVYQRPSMPDYYGKLYGPGVEIVASCINSEKECVNLTTANDVLQKIVVGLNYEIGPEKAIEYLGAPDVVAVAPVGGEIFICEVYLIWKNSRLVLTSTFRADNDLEGVKKYCDVVRDTAKVPSSLSISEARYLSATELSALLSGTGKFFEFTEIIPDR